MSDEPLWAVDTSVAVPFVHRQHREHELVTAGSSLAALLAEVEVAGGAVYDGLVALAAHQHDVVLLTRDHRARNTYARIGVRTEVVA